MALTIKAPEAEELARSLALLMGETETAAVTGALRERLARERAKRDEAASLPARVAAFAERIRPEYDTRPVSAAEWNAASGDEA